MSTREAIVTALQTVDGLHPSTVPPDTPAPGSAWPVWTHTATPGYGGLVDNWHVLVILPASIPLDAMRAAHPLVDQCWAALLAVGEVSVCEPVTVSQGDPAATASGLPALRFTMSTAGEK